MLENIKPDSNLKKLVTAQLEAWPEHTSYLTKSFSSRSAELMDFSYVLADLIYRLCEFDLKDFVADYRWLCEKFNEEQLHFRRTGRYRHTSLSEVTKEVYDNPEFMKRYMQGLLVSQIFWRNHFSIIHYYVTRFLPGNPAQYRHLEIGPGHGLLLGFAAIDPRCQAASGWDISQTSLEQTQRNMRTLGLQAKVSLKSQNAAALEESTAKFDSIVISEVLEHLEDPMELLKALRELLARDGRIFINFPINSPAPDHIFLLKTPEEVVDFVAEAGLRVSESRVFPMTGYSEEAARKRTLTISCGIVAKC